MTTRRQKGGATASQRQVAAVHMICVPSVVAPGNWSPHGWLAAAAAARDGLREIPSFGMETKKVLRDVNGKKNPFLTGVMGESSWNLLNLYMIMFLIMFSCNIYDKNK